MLRNRWFFVFMSNQKAAWMRWMHEIMKCGRCSVIGSYFSLPIPHLHITTLGLIEWNKERNGMNNNRNKRKREKQIEQASERHTEREKQKWDGNNPCHYFVLRGFFAASFVLCHSRSGFDYQASREGEKFASYVKLDFAPRIRDWSPTFWPDIGSWSISSASTHRDK